MQRQHLNRLISWQATAFYHATARFRRPKVTAIQCGRCRRWVKPRRHHPRLALCNDCVPLAVLEARYYMAYRRKAIDAAAANRRAYDKETREWRRHARVTAAR